MQLETDRLILRDYAPSDFAAFYHIRTDPETMYYMQDLFFSSEAEARAEFDGMLADQRRENREFYFFLIEAKDTLTPLGSVGYTVTDRAPVGKLVHAGYFIYPRFWGRGYMSEAFRRVLEYAFTEGGVYRVTTGCLRENVGSERVMQKCGLIKEAEHVDWEWHDGRIKTRLEYRLLRSEWLHVIGR